MKCCAPADVSTKTKPASDLIGLLCRLRRVVRRGDRSRPLRLLPLPPARATLFRFICDHVWRKPAAAVQAIFAAGFSALSRSRSPINFTLEAARHDRGSAIVPEGNAHLLVDVDGQDLKPCGRKHVALARFAREPKAESLTPSRHLKKVQKDYGRCAGNFSNSLRATG